MKKKAIHSFGWRSFIPRQFLSLLPLLPMSLGLYSLIKWVNISLQRKVKLFVYQLVCVLSVVRICWYWDTLGNRRSGRLHTCMALHSSRFKPSRIMYMELKSSFYSNLVFPGTKGSIGLLDSKWLCIMALYR